MAAGGAIAAPESWAVETILDRLTGDWALERKIDNGVTVVGRVSFIPFGDGRLHYREEGRMRLPQGPSLDAHAEYAFAQDSDVLAMFFPETPVRVFQRFTLRHEGGALIGSSVHPCAPDIYESTIAFEPDGGWSLTHAVTGPRKAYVSRSVHRR